MALGEFTKQIAQQALLNATKEPPAPTPPVEHGGSVVLGQIAAMQKALKEDEELAVWYLAGAERVRVMEVFVPSREMIVLSGMDAERTLTRVICAIESAQLVCKVVKVQPGTKPARVGLIMPKAKP
jgi:hypothetical protein